MNTKARDRPNKTLAGIRARGTKAAKKHICTEALSKEKIETVADILGIYYGLSSKSKESIVYNRIFELASLGFSPQKIIEYLQVKK